MCAGVIACNREHASERRRWNERDGYDMMGRILQMEMGRILQMEVGREHPLACQHCA